MKNNLTEKQNADIAEKNKYFREHPEERRKELFEKRKYYREHPEEARKEASKKFDGH